MTEHVSVVYCPTPDEVWQVNLTFSEPLTVAEVVAQSGILQHYPALNDEVLSLGIFGHLCLPDRLVQAGDRIEIYRPLFFDPMQSRRRRAAHRLAQVKKEKTEKAKEKAEKVAKEKAEKAEKAEKEKAEKKKE